jgi:hypothetical protein
VAELFGDQEHVLKVRSALAALNRLSYRWSSDPRDAKAIRDDLDALRTAPQMQPIAEIEAWHAVSSGLVSLPDEMRADLRRLLAPGSARHKLGCPDADDAAAQGIAKEALVRWRVFLNTEANPQQQAIARTALRSYQLIWSSLR